MKETATVRIFLAEGDPASVRTAEISNWTGKAVAGPRSQLELILQRVDGLIKAGEVLISANGYDELAEDNLSIREIVEGVANGAIVEEYPQYHKGPCILVSQQERSGNSVHVVWGIPKGLDKPAVLVTAYRPDPERWDKNFLRRGKR